MKHVQQKKSEIIGRESDQSFNSFIRLVMEKVRDHNKPGKLVCREIIEHSVASVD